MNEDKILSRNRAPVSHDLFLDHVPCKRFLKQRILQEIELAGRKIVCGAPIAVHLLQQFIGDRAFFFYGLIRV